MRQIVDGEIAVHRLLCEPVAGAPGIVDMPAAVLKEHQGAKAGKVHLFVQAVHHRVHSRVEPREEPLILAMPGVALAEVPPAIFDLRVFGCGADADGFFEVVVGAEAVLAVGNGDVEIEGYLIMVARVVRSDIELPLTRDRAGGGVCRRDGEAGGGGGWGGGNEGGPGQDLLQPDKEFRLRGAGVTQGIAPLVADTAIAQGEGGAGGSRRGG